MNLQKVIKHRNLCRLIDFKVDSSMPSQKIVYLFSEAYNASLNDLYITNKNENADFTEGQLVEIAFQILKALHFVEAATGGWKCQLEMDSIYFNEKGHVMLEDISG